MHGAARIFDIDDAGAPPAEDWFTYGGKALVPICLVGGTTLCGPNQQAQEVMPTWATGGWYYYRLEVETGSNLRFFWSPKHQTWVVQEPDGSTMEFGVPQDNAADTGELDGEFEGEFEGEDGRGDGAARPQGVQ